ncbi:FxsA family protein [Rhodobacter capsulatus]|uniref:FxsA family protein n=1 Tax=Rhodobacter capsulatus TaxID=1061 RepID=UPI004026BE35
MWFLILLIAWPLIEIGLFVEIGGRLGMWPVLGLVLGTAALGIAVLRAQSARAQLRLRQAMEGFGNPAAPLAEEALMLVAGGLLILPGLFADALGLLLLLPPLRRLLIARLSRRVVVQRFGMAPQAARPDPAEPGVIDGEFQEIDPKNPSIRGTSGWTRH